MTTLGRLAGLSYLVFVSLCVLVPPRMWARARARNKDLFGKDSFVYLDRFLVFAPRPVITAEPVAPSIVSLSLVFVTFHPTIPSFSGIVVVSFHGHFISQENLSCPPGLVPSSRHLFFASHPFFTFHY